MSRPRFYVWSTAGQKSGQTFWILDRAHNHREVAHYKTGGFGGGDAARTAAVARYRCDQLNRLHEAIL
jgi:hypothetical protein